MRHEAGAIGNLRSSCFLPISNEAILIKRERGYVFKGATAHLNPGTEHDLIHWGHVHVVALPKS